MIPLEQLMAAKGNRDHVRDQLVKLLRSTPNLSAEIVALLRADSAASAELQTALSVPIHDSFPTPSLAEAAA